MKSKVWYLILAIGLSSFVGDYFDYSNCYVSYADEWSCTAAYGKAVIAAEDAARSVQAGDACGAANGIEVALNWLGTAEIECAGDTYKLKEVLKLKNQLIPLLAKYVSICGH